MYLGVRDRGWFRGLLRRARLGHAGTGNVSRGKSHRLSPATYQVVSALRISFQIGSPAITSPRSFQRYPSGISRTVHHTVHRLSQALDLGGTRDSLPYLPTPGYTPPTQTGRGHAWNFLRSTKNM